MSDEAKISLLSIFSTMLLLWIAFLLAVISLQINIVHDELKKQTCIEAGFGYMNCDVDEMDYPG